MMIITPDILKALFTSYLKNYQDGLASHDPQWMKIATLIKSNSASNTYGWMGQWPQFREWIGDRVLKDMATHGYAIVNKDFESTVGVKANDIEDDNIGAYAPMMTEVGRATSAHPDELIFGLLGKGSVTKCYDGQNFFDTDHPVSESVDGQGAIETVSNLYSGSVASIPWYLLDTSRALKPLIYQERTPAKFTAMTSAEDEAVFMRKEFRYGVDSRCNVGVGFWQMAAMSTEEFSDKSFATAFTGMRSLKADGGRPLNVSPSILVVSTQLEDAAKEIINSEKINGKYNPHKGKVEILVSPYL